MSRPPTPWGLTTFYGYDGLDRLTSETIAGGGLYGPDPGYNPDGNMTAYDGKEYAWNGENRLVAVTPLMPVEDDQKLLLCMITWAEG